MQNIFTIIILSTAILLNVIMVRRKGSSSFLNVIAIVVCALALVVRLMR
ncbi:hypothetical protein SAMN05660297_02912 [Natronincola peptidivorans]|uniref:Uncharacterized protein n=1 Tax=Natronincola peptidivorans TaxID=426128 RepID=A0A1I0FR94_9FIRM|nr:hypothetical protein SAMN05660297_02912 [Natronincola peptidivorans]